VCVFKRAVGVANWRVGGGQELPRIARFRGERVGRQRVEFSCPSPSHLSAFHKEATRV
jgi:hypothetical protein